MKEHSQAYRKASCDTWWCQVHLSCGESKQIVIQGPNWQICISYMYVKSAGHFDPEFEGLVFDTLYPVKKPHLFSF